MINQFHLFYLINLKAINEFVYLIIWLVSYYFNHLFLIYEL